MWIIPPVAGLIEPASAPEIYVDGIGAVYCTGQSLRIAYYAEEMPLIGGSSERVVKFWLRRPASQTAMILSHVARINAFFTERDSAPPPGKPYLVR